MNDQIQFVSGAIRPIECFKEAWELIKPNFWILFAISFAGMLIGGATMYVLLPAMICGIYYCFLGAIEGVEPQFEDLFKGFGFWKPALLVVVVLIVPMLVVIGLIYVPLILAAAMGSNLSGDELIGLFIGMFAIEFVIALIMICVQTLLFFAFPLIVDKKLSGWVAIKVSSRAVMKNLAGIVGIWVVGFVVSMVGMLAFCVGVYLTIPIILAANVVAYRKVFPGTFTGNTEPAGQLMN